LGDADEKAPEGKKGKQQAEPIGSEEDQSDEQAEVGQGGAPNLELTKYGQVEDGRHDQRGHRQEKRPGAGARGGAIEVDALAARPRGDHAAAKYEQDVP